MKIPPNQIPPNPWLYVCAGISGTAAAIYSVFARNPLASRLLLGCAVMQALVALAPSFIIPRKVTSLPRRTGILIAMYVLFFTSLGILFAAADRGAFIEPIRDRKEDSFSP
jgi:hypothetical protein